MTDIQILEGLRNDDHAAIVALESEQKEILTIIEWAGTKRSVDMRLFERLNAVCNAWLSRTRSFELNQILIERLTGKVEAVRIEA
jgi:hypothetical protein